MSSTTPPPPTTTTTSSRARAYLPFCSSIKIIFLFGVGCCCVLVRQLILSSNRYSTYHNVNEMFSFEAPPIITQAFDLKQQGDGSHEDDTKKQFTNKILHTKKIRTTTLELKRATTVQTKEHHEPLNVIIFYPDDMRYDSLQDVRGQELVKTPFLTELAKQGMRFTHNAVTTSICWVSRATLFTGQYSSQHGAEKLYCPRFTLRNYWKWTWPNLLKEKAGYFTGHVGKWYVPKTM